MKTQQDTPFRSSKRQKIENMLLRIRYKSYAVRLRFLIAVSRLDYMKLSLALTANKLFNDSSALATPRTSISSARKDEIIL